MNRILVSMTMLLFSLSSYTQQDSIWKQEFRNLATTNYADRQMDVQLVMSLADSLYSSTGNMYLMKLDSMVNDSSKSYEEILLVIEMEKYLWYKSNNKLQPATLSLKYVFENMKLQESGTAFYTLIANYLIREFSLMNDWKGAHDSQQLLYQSLLSQKERDFTTYQDSLGLLNAKMTDQQKESLLKLKKSKEQNDLLLYALCGAGLLCILLLITFLVVRYSLRKKLRMLLEKKPDTTDLDVLTNKLNSLKTEAQQFKQTAQLSIDRLNTMDQSHRKSALEVEKLNEEITTALDELKSISESGKNNMTPALYMALQNVGTRLSNSTAQSILQIRSLLK